MRELCLQANNYCLYIGTIKMSGLESLIQQIKEKKSYLATNDFTRKIHEVYLADSSKREGQKY